MKLLKHPGNILAAATFIAASANLISFVQPSCGDVEKTIIITEEPIQLKSNVSYVVVDPMTGDIRENFVPAQTIDVQSVPAGAVVVERESRRVVATINPSGKLISIQTAPTFDPLASALDKRRSELNQLINSALDNGTLTENQAKDLRGQLDIVGRQQADQTSRGRQLTYSESISLADQLNDTAKQFSNFSHTSPLPPLLGARFIVKKDQIIMTE